MLGVLDAYFNEGKQNVDAQKCFFQEQLIRTEISKYQKIHELLSVLYERTGL